MRPRLFLTGLCVIGLALPAGADALLEKARKVPKEGICTDSFSRLVRSLLLSVSFNIIKKADKLEA